MSEFYTRIPDWIFDELRSGKINSKMFLVLSWMFKHADWKTGIVRKVSAKRIREEMWGDEVEDKRPSLRTIQEYLWRFRECDYWKSSHIPGQRQTYIIALNNYIAVTTDKEGARIEELLRPTKTKDWHDLPKTRCADNDGFDCADVSGDASADASGDPSAHTTLCTTLCTTPSQHPNEQERKQASEQAATPPSPSVAPLEGQPHGGSAPEPPSRTPASVWSGAIESGADEDHEALSLYWSLNPVGGNGTQAVTEGVKRTRKLIDLLEGLDVDAENLLLWNRTHKPEKLRIKSLARFEKAIQGTNGECALLNDYLTHSFNTCKVCKQENILSNAECRKIKRELKQQAEARRRAAALREEVRQYLTTLRDSHSDSVGFTPSEQGVRDFIVVINEKVVYRVRRATGFFTDGEHSYRWNWDAMLDYFVQPGNWKALTKAASPLLPVEEKGFEVQEELV